MPRGVTNHPDLDKILALTIADRAYIAGFFDGEGYVSLHVARNEKRGASYVRVIVGIAQKRGPMLAWIHEMFGGSLFLYQRNDRGFSSDGGTIHRWTITSMEHVNLFYRAVRPYLRLKGEEFDIAIKTVNSRVRMEEVSEAINKIRDLRVVGE